MALRALKSFPLAFEKPRPRHERAAENRAYRRQRLVKNEFIFYTFEFRNCLATFVNCVYWSENSLKRNM